MKRKLKIKDMVGFLLILFGILIIAYPQLKRHYYDKKQEKLLEEFLESMEAIEVIEEEKDCEDASNSFEISSYHGNSRENIAVDENKKEENKKELLEKWPVEGTLYIEKIDFKMPVLSGATKEHLDISVASIENTGKPWEGGNYAIAGHRSRTYGRHFNRLNELEVGDRIILEDRKNVKYIYEVFDKYIVDEKEISVLEDKGISEITLITCDPINQKNPPTRLIIKGKQIN